MARFCAHVLDAIFHAALFLPLCFVVGVCLMCALKMEFSLEDFVAQPILDKFHRFTKEHLIVVADHFDVTVSKQSRKQVIKSELWSALSERCILPCDPGTPKAGSPVGKHNSAEILRLKELEIEMRHLDIKEKELHNELEIRKMEEETKRQICLKELELNQPSSITASHSRSDEFNVNKCIRLIPKFTESDVDKYFTLFERVANTLKWPKSVWPVLL